MRHHYCDECGNYRPLVNDKICRNCIEYLNNIFNLVSEVYDLVVNNEENDEELKIDLCDNNRILVDSPGNTYNNMIGLEKSIQMSM